ncbi:universal stress protein [Streptomyces albipurpureus]|uniref:Universal stress protein n=1 Tax=Streptomyces albipurpureus TaxID=2897419 RepID=A0ABT0ULJ8_9ACTN|nr:universal stress protein [Streptomyces sp. CWNU-1]MCM2389325.1 universal stress protein [Streptomyces sp. CWNU-1]
MTHHVTAGVDGSPEGLAAAEWAVEEARLRGVPLRLVHVAEKPLTLVVAALAINADQPAGAAGADAAGDAVLRETARTLRERHPDIEITTRRRSGRAPAALASEADEAGMLVLGSRGLGGVAGFLIGSVGTATIGATARPVVLVRPAPAGEPGPAPVGRSPDGGRDQAAQGDVVVAVDIHDPADETLVFAFDEAARRGCAVRAVHGWRLPRLLGLAIDGDSRLDLEREITRTLRDLLLPWRQRYPSVKVVEEARTGSPAHAVLAASAQAALVVVGRRVRRSPVGGHIGSVAHAVLHHSIAPVAIVAHN